MSSPTGVQCSSHLPPSHQLHYVNDSQPRVLHVPMTTGSIWVRPSVHLQRASPSEGTRISQTKSFKFIGVFEQMALYSVCPKETSSLSIMRFRTGLVWPDNPTTILGTAGVRLSTRILLRPINAARLTPVSTDDFSRRDYLHQHWLILSRRAAISIFLVCCHLAQPGHHCR